MSSSYFRKCVTLWRLKVKKFFGGKRKQTAVAVSFPLEVGMTDDAFEFMVKLLRAGYSVQLARVFAEAWDATERDPGSLYVRLRKLLCRLNAEELYAEGIITDVDAFLE